MRIGLIGNCFCFYLRKVEAKKTLRCRRVVDLRIDENYGFALFCKALLGFAIGSTVVVVL